jgi:YbbR domain-containing protein
LEYIYVSSNSKYVPVKLTGNITADRQHYLSDTIFSSDSVLIYASPDVLDTITAAYTRPVELQNISDTVKYLSTFSPVKGVKFVPDSVELTFPVDVYTEKMLEIPIHSMGFPPNKILRTFPSKVQVTVQIGLKHFYEINSENFSIEMSYDDLLKLDTDRYSVKLKNIPLGVNRILRIVPEQIDFLIETISL